MRDIASGHVPPRSPAMEAAYQLYNRSTDSLRRLHADLRATPSWHAHGHALLDNPFPYHVSADVRHLVLFFDGDGSDADWASVRARAEARLNAAHAAWRSHAVIHVNPPACRSVPILAHVHLFVSATSIANALVSSLRSAASPRPSRRVSWAAPDQLESVLHFPSLGTSDRAARRARRRRRASDAYASARRDGSLRQLMRAGRRATLRLRRQDAALLRIRRLLARTPSPRPDRTAARIAASVSARSARAARAAAQIAADAALAISRSVSLSLPPASALSPRLTRGSVACTVCAVVRDSSAS